MGSRQGRLEAPFPGEVAFDLLALGCGKCGIIHYIFHCISVEAIASAWYILSNGGRVK